MVIVEKPIIKNGIAKEWYVDGEYKTKATALQRVKQICGGYYVTNDDCTYFGRIGEDNYLCRINKPTKCLKNLRASRK
jgi:hypothetical protein